MDQYYDRLTHHWNCASAKRQIWYYVGIYTIIFLAAVLIAYSPFLQAGVSFITKGDGSELHYPYFVYVGRTLRQVFLNFLHGDFALPMFDLNMQMGDEVIGQLNGLRYTDPLMILSAFVPTKYAEYLYNFLCIFRIYLAGLSFSCLCFHFNKRKAYTLIGSIVYSCSGYGILVTVRHSIFVNSLIVLPLLILGTEKVLKRKHPYVLIFAVFYGFLCGYYMMYMMTLMMFVYAFIRFFDLYKMNRGKEFVQALGRGAGGYLLGAGLSAVALFPALLDFWQSARSGEPSFTSAVYSLNYFINRFLRLITPAKGTGWSYPALAAIVLPALILLLFSKRRSLKILVIVTFATFFTNAGNFVMNGFSYPSARWSFGVVLLLAFIVVEMLPELLDMNRNQRIISFLMLGGYAALVFLNAYGRTRTYAAIGMSFLALTLLVLTAGSGLRDGATVQNVACCRRKNLRALICLFLVAANVGINALYTFVPDQTNYVSNFTVRDYETKRLVTATERELSPFLSSRPDGRADSSIFVPNRAMVWGIPGTTTYSSILKDHIVDFWRKIEDCGIFANVAVYSTDQRTMIDTLISTKYYVDAAERTAYVPYGYSKIKTTNNNNVIYVNDYALPWGYTYDSAISYAELDGMNGLQKQEAMLQAIALNDVEEANAVSDLAFDAKQLPYKAKYRNCSWEDGTLAVSKANAMITLEFVMPANVEGYVRLHGFDMNGSGVIESYATVDCGDISKAAHVSSELYTWDYDLKNFLFNLGYSENERTSLTITFSTKGTFKLDGIELYALPMVHYPKRVEALRAEPLENIVWAANRLTGTVDLSKDKILCVAVPYSKGWSAAVDGEEVEIQRGNYMFMAIPLTAGHHDIEFSYFSPGLKLGFCVTTLSLGIVAGMLFYDKRRKR